MKGKVNLFIVGAPKAGTTSIFLNLVQHQKIYFPKDKELHYFCTDIHEESDLFHGKPIHFKVRSEKDYHKFYENEQFADVLGDASTSYLYSKNAAKRIFKYNPDAKIIICLREPVSLMYSWYHYLHSRSDEVVDSFEDALKLQKSRSLGTNIPKSCIAPIRLQYEYIASLTCQINRYQEHFPKENIHFVVFEKFVKDQRKVTRAIFEFLELDKIETSDIRANSAKKLKSVKLKRLIDANLSWLKYCLNRSDSSLINLVRNYYHKLIFKYEEYPTIAEKTKVKLKTNFSSEVNSLNKLCDIDLIALWGYNNIIEK
jgi:hypothetical protein